MAGESELGHAYVQVVPSFERMRTDLSQFFRKLDPYEVPVTVKQRQVSDALKKAAESTTVAPQVDTRAVSSDVEQAATDAGKRTSRATGAAVSDTAKRTGEATAKASEDAAARATRATERTTRQAADRAGTATQRAAQDAGKQAATSTARAASAAAEDTSTKVARATERAATTAGEAATVRLDADAKALEAKIEDIRSKQRALVVKLDIDETALRKRLEELQRVKPLLAEIDVDAEVAKAKSSIDALLTERKESTIDVDADVARARAKVDNLLKRREATIATIDLRTQTAQRQLRKLRESAASEHPVVDVDLKIEKAQADLAAFAARRRSVELTADADVAKARQELAALEAIHPRVTAEVDADLTQARDRLAYLEGLKPYVGVDVDAQIAKARADLTALESRRRKTTIDAEANVAAARAKLAALDEQADETDGRSVRVDVDASAASRGVLIMAGLTAAIAGVGAAAPAAALAVGAIGAAAAGAGQLIGTLAAGLSGVGDAVEAMQAVDDEAATDATANAQRRIAATNRVASAQASLERAQEQADRAAITGANRVRDARESLARAQQGVVAAQEAGLRRVEAAEESLQRAQESAADAQRALSRAREQARERMEDLRLSVRGAALDEEAATLRLEKAQNRLSAARAQGVSGLALREVELEARQAAHSLDVVRERRGDLAEESARAAQQGVAGDRQVQDARRRVADATRRAQQAEEAMAQARVDAARQVTRAQQRVTDAQQRLAQAQQQAAWSQSDAARQIAAAQRQMEAASVAAADTSSAAMDKLHLAMAQLTPEGRSFARFLHDEMKPALRGIGDEVQTRMLPGLESALRTSLQLAPLVSSAMGETGTVIAELGQRAAAFAVARQDDLRAIAATNNDVLRELGEAGLSFGAAFTDITAAAGPALQELSAWVGELAEDFATWIAELRASGELGAYLSDGVDVLQELFEIGLDVTRALLDLASALAPLGHFLLELVEGAAALVSTFSALPAPLASLTAGALLAFAAFVSLGRGIAGVRAATVSARQGWLYLAESGGVLRQRLLGMTTAANSFNDATRRMVGSAERFQIGAVGPMTRGAQQISERVTRAADTTVTQLGRVGPASTRAGRAMQTMQMRTVTAASRMAETIPPVVSRWESGVRRIGTTARTVGTGIRTGLGRAVSGVAGVFGGPWGLAITGAVTGLGFLMEAQADADRAAQAHQQQVDSLARALHESNGVIDDSVRSLAAKTAADTELSDINQSLMTTVSQLLGRDAVPALTDVYLGNEEAGRQLVSRLREMATAQSENAGAFADVRSVFDDTIYYQGITAKRYNETGYAAKLAADAIEGALPTWDSAVEQSKNLGAAQGDAAWQTDQHRQSILDLADTMSATLNKQLAYERAVIALGRAQDQINRAREKYGADSPQYREAMLQEQLKILDVVQAAYDQRYATSQARNEVNRKREAEIAAREEAARLATKYGSDLPKSLQRYLDANRIARTETGDYIAVLDDVPDKVDTTAQFHDEQARGKIKGFFGWYLDQLKNLNEQQIQPGSAQFPLGNLTGPARGGILGSYASGGIALDSMPAGVATVVPPNTWRVVGDRMRGDEAYIPITDQPRSHAVLAETAQRMGYQLSPMDSGGILAADGGVAESDQQSSLAAVATLPADPAALRALAAAIQTVTTQAVALADRLTVATMPALRTLQRHAGTHSVRALGLLRAELPPLRGAFDDTALTARLDWTRISDTVSSSVRSQGDAFDTLMLGMRRVRESMRNTADWAFQQYGRIRAAAADPIRWVLHNPINAGLIAAWNRLNSDFDLGQHVGPVGVPFASGGRVTGAGSGTSDDIMARLSNGEFVVREAIARRIYPYLNALNEGQAEALQAAGYGYAQGGMVADTGSEADAAVARGTEFAAQHSGEPYVWGGVGPHGFDCSGFTGAITNVLRGDYPYRRLGTTHTMPWSGFVPGLSSRWSLGVSSPHMAGTLNGINAEAGGAPSRVKFGVPNTAGADHPQFPQQYSLPIVGGRFISGGGSLNPDGMVAPYFASTYDMLGKITALFGNLLGVYGEGIGTQAADGTQDYATDRLSRLLSSTASGGSPEVVAAVRAVANQFGWGSGGQWGALSNLVAHESSWNPAAANPTSSARGLFQKMTHIHGPVSPSPAEQAQWGLQYIADRYGSPSAAWAAWQARSPHWYDDGGWLPPGYSTVANHTGKPEAVLTQEQWSDLSRAAQQGGQRPYIDSLTVVTQPGASPTEIVGEAMHQVRHASKGVYAP